MKCVLGFSMFWIGVGMLIKTFLPDTFWVFALTGVLIGVGYLLFSN